MFCPFATPHLLINLLQGDSALEALHRIGQDITPSSARYFPDIALHTAGHQYRILQRCVLPQQQKVLMDNRDEFSAVRGTVKHAVVLGLDDDILQDTGLGQLKEHAQQLALLFDVAYQHRYAAALLQSAELLHHAAVHRLDEGVPCGDSGQVGLRGA